MFQVYAVLCLLRPLLLAMLQVYACYNLNAYAAGVYLLQPLLLAMFQVYAWVAVFVLPLNSAINPVLYTLSTAPFMRNFRKKAWRLRKSLRRSVTADTRHSYVGKNAVTMNVAYIAPDSLSLILRVATAIPVH
jgi:hypothetical protein